MNLTRKRISQLGRVVTGKTPHTGREGFFDGDYAFVTPSDLEYEHYYCRKTERTVTREAKSALPNQFIPAEAVMFTCIGATIGKCGIAPAECLTNQQINSVIANEHTDSKFLYYLLCHNVDVVKGLSGGAATPIVSKSKFEQVELLVPPVRDQRAIAEILSAYDDLIENNRRRMTLLEQGAQELYREWFVRLRFPGHEHTRPMHGVPEGWERAPFETGLVLQRGFDLPAQAREEGDVPIYGSTGINGFHTEAKVTGPGVVTGRSGTLGEVHYVPGPYWPLNTSLWVKDFKRVTPLFAVFLMREMDLRQFNGGVSVPTLDRKTVHKAEILIPPGNLLTSFDEFVAQSFEQTTALRLQAQKLRTARDLLLSRLLSGEIEV